MTSGKSASAFWVVEAERIRQLPEAQQEAELSKLSAKTASVLRSWMEVSSVAKVSK